MFSPASASRIALIVVSLGMCGCVGQTRLEEAVLLGELVPLIEREPDATPSAGSITRPLPFDALPLRGDDEDAARDVPGFSTFFVAMSPSLRPGGRANGSLN